jgi:GNAT superfamily N-acetyltransferase
MNIQIVEQKRFSEQDVLEIYQKNFWSAAADPELLFKALKNSNSLVLAILANKVIGLGNAISDGYLVVYYPHLIVHPSFQGKGIGSLILQHLQIKYRGFHQQMLTADARAISFYEKNGFKKAGNTQSMWIYEGNDH